MIIKREQREKDQNKRKHATSKNCLTLSLIVACEHALRGALEAGREKEGELATTSLDLNVCIEKVDAKCWLAEMTLEMMSLLLACVFQCLFTFVLISTPRWLAEIWQFSRWEPQGNWMWNSNSRDVVASSPSFCRPATWTPRRACPQVSN